MRFAPTAMCRRTPVLVDYCPEILADKDPLNPFANMWDKDEESRKMCELTLPAIQENYYKFDKCRLPSKTAICAMFGGQCVT